MAKCDLETCDNEIDPEGGFTIEFSCVYHQNVIYEVGYCSDNCLYEDLPIIAKNKPLECAC